MARLARMQINTKMLREVLGLPEGTIIHEVRTVTSAGEFSAVEVLLSHETLPLAREGYMTPMVCPVFDIDVFTAKGYGGKFKHWGLKT